MTDILGQADKVTAILTDTAIAAARHAANQPRKLMPNGTCHNCEELVDHPSKLFCDSDCADDHDKRARRNV